MKSVNLIGYVTAFYLLYNNPSYSRILTDARLTSSIITKFFPQCFKMTESFENLDNILHDWAKDRYKKSTVEALNRYEKYSLAGKRKIKPLLS